MAIQRLNSTDFIEVGNRIIQEAFSYLELEPEAQERIMFLFLSSGKFVRIEIESLPIPVVND